MAKDEVPRYIVIEIDTHSPEFQEPRTAESRKHGLINLLGRIRDAVSSGKLPLDGEHSELVGNGRAFGMLVYGKTSLRACTVLTDREAENLQRQLDTITAKSSEGSAFLESRLRPRRSAPSTPPPTPAAQEQEAEAQPQPPAPESE